MGSTVWTNAGVEQRQNADLVIGRISWYGTSTSFDFCVEELELLVSAK
jgi:hypothetical protein